MRAKTQDSGFEELGVFVARGSGSAVAEQSGIADYLSELQGRMLDDGPATCICDAEGRLLYSNSAYRRIAEALAEIGAGPRPLLDKAALGQAPDRQATLEALCSALSRDYTLTLGGRSEAYSAHHRPLLRSGFDDYAIASTYTPRSREQALRSQLAIADERLEDITRLVSDWIWETNRNLVLTFVSPRVNQVLGFHQIELTGRRLYDLPVEPAPRLQALASAEGRQPFRDLEIEIRDRRGENRVFLLSGLPIYCPDSGDHLGFRGTAQDVTELRARERQLLAAKENAELANRAKSEFLANMSHELRTPLNAIMGFSEIMSDQLLGPLGSDQYQHYCEDIHDSAEHLLTLINDILSTAKLEAGKMELHDEIVAPMTVFEAVRRLVSGRAQTAGVDLVVHDHKPLPKIRVDVTKIKQILINLLSNATKFTPSGGRVELRGELTEGGDLVIIVSDSGIGIAPTDIPRALAPFGQVDSRLNRKFEGTGLGLPLAKALTELHGGSFELTSEPKVGTTVVVRLPASRVIPPHANEA
ncbi:MAG: PAS domain-containing sensor histidine kinase [Kiloniellales bacterium]